MIVLVYAEKGDDISSRSETVPERETDGRTERKAELISISPVNFAVLTRDNDSHCSHLWFHIRLQLHPGYTLYFPRWWN